MSELLGGILKGCKMHLPGLPMFALAFAIHFVSLRYTEGSAAWLMLRIAVAVFAGLGYTTMFWWMGALPSLEGRIDRRQHNAEGRRNEIH